MTPKYVLQIRCLLSGRWQPVLVFFDLENLKQVHRALLNDQIYEYVHIRAVNYQELTEVKL